MLLPFNLLHVCTQRSPDKVSRFKNCFIYKTDTHKFIFFIGIDSKCFVSGGRDHRGREPSQLLLGNMPPARINRMIQRHMKWRGG